MFRRFAVIDIGTGPPVVLVPGIQGRWEWMRPAVRALARRCRVMTFTLCGEVSSPPPAGFDSFTAQIDDVLEAAGVERAAICGVSYGGLIALRYAAARPARTARLILASAPSPHWRANGRVRRYLRAPRLYTPAFVLGSPFRLLPEIAAAFPHLAGRAAFSMAHAARVVAAPFSPTHMAHRVRLLDGLDLVADCARVSAPTLVVTGEPALDRVVPVDSTREYLRLIPGARAVTLERTGHIGLVTRPDRFAELVAGFAGDEAETIRVAS